METLILIYLICINWIALRKFCVFPWIFWWICSRLLILFIIIKAGLNQKKVEDENGINYTSKFRQIRIQNCETLKGIFCDTGISLSHMPFDFHSNSPKCVKCKTLIDKQPEKPMHKYTFLQKHFPFFWKNLLFECGECGGT